MEARRPQVPAVSARSRAGPLALAVASTRAVVDGPSPGGSGAAAGCNPKDTRILHSGSRAQDKGYSRNPGSCRFLSTPLVSD